MIKSGLTAETLNLFAILKMSVIRSMFNRSLNRTLHTVETRPTCFHLDEGDAFNLAG